METVLFFTPYEQQLSHTAEILRRWSANHAVKCFRSQLEQLAKDFPSFCGRGCLAKSVIMKITHGAKCAIRNHSKTNNITKLRNDLGAGPKHYLGYHKDCDPSWRSEAAKETPVSVNLHDVHLTFSLRWIELVTVW